MANFVILIDESGHDSKKLLAIFFLEREVPAHVYCGGGGGVVLKK
jgi:hypothetical protein